MSYIKHILLTTLLLQVSCREKFIDTKEIKDIKVKEACAILSNKCNKLTNEDLKDLKEAIKSNFLQFIRA